MRRLDSPLVGHFARQCPTRGLSSLLNEEEQVPQERQVEIYETSQDWEEEYETQYVDEEIESPIGVIRCTLTKVHEED